MCVNGNTTHALIVMFVSRQKLKFKRDKGIGKTVCFRSAILREKIHFRSWLFLKYNKENAVFNNKYHIVQVQRDKISHNNLFILIEFKTQQIESKTNPNLIKISPFILLPVYFCHS